MIIFPAIDLRAGRVVRLRQGSDKEQITYSDDPGGVAFRWESEGASWLHVVDLDAALGEPGDTNSIALERIRASVRIPIQRGGGLRSMESISRAFDRGADRVVVGTMAIENPPLFAQVLEQFGSDRVVVAIDMREGLVATHGWRALSPITGVDFGKQMRELGVVRAVVTDISRDGMLSGIDANNLVELARESGLQVIASGGIGSLDHLRGLLPFRNAGIEGAIVGQALYSGAFTLREAIQETQAC